MSWFQPTWWFVVAGASGAAIDAVITGRYGLFPARASGAKGSPIARLGLLSHMAIGGGVGLACLGICGLTDSLAAQSTAGLRPHQIVELLLLSFVVCRWVTAEVEKRLLRAAASRACRAPAAHPETIREMEAATPQSVYAMCDKLVPESALWASTERQPLKEFVCQ